MTSIILGSSIEMSFRTPCAIRSLSSSARRRKIMTNTNFRLITSRDARKCLKFQKTYTNSTKISFLYRILDFVTCIRSSEAQNGVLRELAKSMGAELIVVMDTDGNGVVSFDEFKAAQSVLASNQRDIRAAIKSTSTVMQMSSKLAGSSPMVNAAAGARTKI